MRITLVMLLCTLALLSGCDGVSLTIMLPNPDADGDTSPEPSEDDAAIGPDSFLLCVINQSSEPITYRVSVIGLEPVADGAAAGEPVCYDAPCGFNFGIDAIMGTTISNPAGAQYLGEQAPCGSIFELRVQSDGSVSGILNTAAGDS